MSIKATSEKPALERSTIKSQRKFPPSTGTVSHRVNLFEMKSCLAILFLFISGGCTLFLHSEAYLWPLKRQTDPRATCMAESIAKAKGNGRCREMSEDVIKSTSIAMFRCLAKRYGRKDLNLGNPNSRISFKEFLSTENADDNVVTHIELLRSRVMVMCFLLHDAEVSSHIEETAKGLRGELNDLKRVKGKSKVSGMAVKKCSAIFDASSALKSEAQLDFQLSRSNAAELQTVKDRLEQELELIRTVEEMTESGSAAGLLQLQKARNLIRDAVPQTREHLSCAAMTEVWRAVGLLAHLFAFTWTLAQRNRVGARGPYTAVKDPCVHTAGSRPAINQRRQTKIIFALLLILDIMLCLRDILAQASSEEVSLLIRSASVVNYILSSFAEWTPLKPGRREARRHRNDAYTVIEDSSMRDD